VGTGVSTKNKCAKTKEVCRAAQGHSRINEVEVGRLLLWGLAGGPSKTHSGRQEIGGLHVTWGGGMKSGGFKGDDQEHLEEGSKEHPIHENASPCDAKNRYPKKRENLIGASN